MAAVSVRVVCWSYCEADSLVMVPIACDVSLCHGAQGAAGPGLGPVGAGATAPANVAHAVRHALVSRS